VIESVNRGEFALGGFRNRDLRQLLYPPTQEPKLQRRRSVAITRTLALLRTHGLIRKIPTTHRYQLTAKGHRAINALITARDTIVEDLLKIAAWKSSQESNILTDCITERIVNVLAIFENPVGL
jgi:hypothetical protein